MHDLASAGDLPTPAALLTQARGTGLRVQAIAGKLQVHGPQQTDPALVQALLAHKADLMPVLLGLDGQDPQDLCEWFGERAAIREYDGGQTRTKAERATWAELEANGGNGLW